MILFAVGIVSGLLTDVIAKRYQVIGADCAAGFELHNSHELSFKISLQAFLAQWKKCSPFRATLTAALALVLFGIISGQIGESEQNWVTATLVAVSSFALFIVATVPDHFLEEHLWKHVAKEHAIRIFLWTLGALVLLHFLTGNMELQQWMQDKTWGLLVLASLIGIVPESGPHLIFVTMFAHGLIPMSILLANSIVQDGHGMLPMLAYSRKTFFIVKFISLLVGLTVGSAVLAAGF
ncbi:MAG: hypothetical protein HGB11_01010 [Chlorobiales bacterium]|nr:hypothetical protein [Chlorobiales bacterium]